MRNIAFILSLVGFLLLAACNQSPSTDLSNQGLEYGEARFNVVSDFREGFKETNFNGQFDEGEFLVPELEIKLTPVDEKGQVIGEPFSFITNRATTPLEGTVLKLPVGRYQPELILPTDLQGGEKYAWKPVGPNIPPLPPIAIEYKHRFDGIYSVACGFGGRMFVEINGFDEYPKSPCYSQIPEAQDSLSVSPDTVEFPCNSQQIQTMVKVYSAKGIINNPVTLSVDPNSLPAGMTASFSPTSTTTQSTLTLVRNGVAPGSYQIIIRDSRGLTTRLTVRVPSIIFIPDSNLKSSLRDELNFPQNFEICQGDLLSLTQFSARSRNISNLEGLQFATNLTVLDLPFNTISDLSPLAGLRSLTRLVLSGNTISDLTPLSRLTNLTNLILAHNAISDLTPLSGLTNLTILYLGFNAISDLTPLVVNSNSSGLRSGDEVYLMGNLLDLSGPPDPDLANINILTNRGVAVYY
jgi:hypothetical protein